jgi:hypothetical protein
MGLPAGIGYPAGLKISPVGLQGMPPTAVDMTLMVDISKDNSLTGSVKGMNSKKMKKILKKLSKIKPRSARKWFKGPKYTNKKGVKRGTFYHMVDGVPDTAARTAGGWTKTLQEGVTLGRTADGVGPGLGKVYQKQDKDEQFTRMGFRWDSEGKWEWDMEDVDEEYAHLIKFSVSGGGVPKKSKGATRVSMSKAVSGATY